MYTGQRQLLLSDEWERLYWLLTVGLQYFTQHGYHVIVLSFGARSHFSFIAWMFYNASVRSAAKKNNNSIDVLFTVCAADHNYVIK